MYFYKSFIATVGAVFTLAGAATAFDGDGECYQVPFHRDTDTELFECFTATYYHTGVINESINTLTL